MWRWKYQRVIYSDFCQVVKYDVKVRRWKVKLSLFTPWGYYRGSGGVAALILGPGYFNPEKEPPVPLQKKIEWAEELVWMIWRRENLLAVPGIEPLVVQPVA